MTESFLDIPDGRVWIEKIGTGMPLVLIHGGPGVGSDYLSSLMQLNTEGLMLIRYDQLGCGRSRKEFTPSLTQVGRYIEELKLILESCSVNGVHLLGHSWGAVVAIEFALAYPSAVSSLLLASPAINIPRWCEDARRLRKKLPLMSQMILSQAEQDGQFEFRETVDALSELYDRFVNGSRETSEIVSAAVNPLANWEVYKKMWGPNELVVNGTLRNYDVTTRLSELEVPVLLTCGRNELSTPEALHEYAGRLKRKKVVIFEESAHFPHVTEKDAFSQCVVEWLKELH